MHILSVFWYIVVFQLLRAGIKRLLLGGNGGEGILSEMGEQVSAPAGDNGNEKGVSGDGENGSCGNAGHEKRFAEMRECKDQPLEKRTGKADAELCKNLEYIQPDPKKKQILCYSDRGESIEMTGQILKRKKQHRHIGKPECSGEQRHQKSRRERLLPSVFQGVQKCGKQRAVLRSDAVLHAVVQRCGGRSDADDGQAQGSPQKA